MLGFFLAHFFPLSFFALGSTIALSYVQRPRDTDELTAPD